MIEEVVVPEIEDLGRVVESHAPGVAVENIVVDIGIAIQVEAASSGKRGRVVHKRIVGERPVGRQMINCPSPVTGIFDKPVVFNRRAAGILDVDGPGVAAGAGGRLRGRIALE